MDSVDKAVDRSLNNSLHRPYSVDIALHGELVVLAQNELEAIDLANYHLSKITCGHRYLIAEATLNKGSTDDTHL